MTADALFEAIRAGDRERVRDVVETLDEATRKKSLPAVRKFLDVPDWPVFDAAELAGLGCQATPASAVKWILATDRKRSRLAGGSGNLFPAESLPFLPRRDPAFLGELTHLLAATLDQGRHFEWGTHPRWALIQALQTMSGCATPTSEGYAALYMRMVDRLDDLRADPATGTLLPIALDIDGAGTYIDRMERSQADYEKRMANTGQEYTATPGWKDVLVALTESGELDRAALIDQCAGRLIRGGKSQELRAFRQILDRLELTDDELTHRAGDWARVAADAETPAAGDAVARLRRLTETGRLAPAGLTDASREILARPEKTVVVAQLKVIGVALGDHGYAPSTLLPAVAVAFGHEDASVQEQAWKIVVKHISAVDAEARTQVIEALPNLTPDLQSKARAELGTAEEADVDHRETLPPISRPLRAVPHETLTELVQDVAVQFEQRCPEGCCWHGWRWTERAEQILDGLVRFAHRDRTKLAEALRTLEFRHEWEARENPPGFGIPLVAKVLTGEVAIEDVPNRPPAGNHTGGRWDGEDVIDDIWKMRTWEAAHLIGFDAPLLLATPSWNTGAIETDALVERLAEYARQSRPAGPVDFDQALLRMRRTQPGPERDRLAAAAAALGTRDGARLAEWMSIDGLRIAEEDADIVLPVVRETFGDPVRRLGDRQRSHRSSDLRLRQWVATTPVLRGHIVDQALRIKAHKTTGWASDLPLLVEADGPMTPAIHELVANGLARADRAEWPGLIDGLLQLIARGELDPVRCGTELGRVNAAWSGREHQPPEPLDLLTELARAGAPATVWGILSGALPGLLPEGRRPRKIGALLSLAADCASRVGAAGAIDGLDAVADAKGSSLTVKQARRLRDYLSR
ncbi:hypothetical protein DMB66_19680 [Actinoplanes sp. ATCC 53533]|uniref:DUF6493 family protein n=1 Tax=Actinoplanes sp. ATCC 53533 TaxID=1288362 RepID=UPI000F77E23F|nr:DUF6493 family protein [Actinoplanes sp. ATCC 53533]RSM64546.1 hypothetical protein DMB66_19680 [Actinoplanes sp. ATCC 53533]